MCSSVTFNIQPRDWTTGVWERRKRQEVDREIEKKKKKTESTGWQTKMKVKDTVETEREREDERDEQKIQNLSSLMVESQPTNEPKQQAC